METDGGGWIVLQRRRDGHEDFYRTWDEYAWGFGELDNEFWLGNAHLYRLTNQHEYGLRVDMEDFEGEKRYAVYDTFRIGSPRQKFILTITGYSGDATDSLEGHNGFRFSTKDHDYDTYPDSCATKFEGSWWYSKCHSSNLNGRYLGGAHVSYANGVNWQSWKGYHYSLKFTEMKIRPSIEIE